jgi:predicted GNAT family acetyltransferase
VTRDEVEALIKTKTRDRVIIHHVKEHVGDSVAFLSYAIDEQKKVTIWHTEVPTTLQHMGIGGRLIEETMRLISPDASGLRIVCPFAKHYLARHPELAKRYSIAAQASIAPDGF